MTKDIGASVRARLLDIAKAQGADFNQILVRFALERMLYRLSRSRHEDRGIATHDEMTARRRTDQLGVFSKTFIETDI